MMTVAETPIFVEPTIRTVSLDHYVATVLLREMRLFTDVEMVGLLDDPHLSETGLMTGRCCPEDETPYVYVINGNTARLEHLSAVQS